MSTFLDCLIIGAGPAGIAAAYEARKRGIASESILLIEKSDQVAYNVRAKYPDEKMVLTNYKGQLAACLGDVCIHDMTKTEFLTYLDEVLAKSQVTVNFNESVLGVKRLKNGQLQVETTKDSYLATSVFVALGTMGTPRKLNLKYSREVGARLVHDIQDLSVEDKHVLVIGGGDSASEFCQYLTERGVQVQLSYRQAEFASMSGVNREKLLALIAEKKVTFYPSSEAVSVEMKGPSVEVTFTTSAKALCDKVILALGFESPKNLLASLKIEMSCEEGVTFCEASHEGMYFIGDLAQKKGGSINIAFNSAYEAISEACINQLNCDLKS
jgi:thioredoxin reductase (NADPH)